MAKNHILCSRCKCGCLASAWLGNDYEDGMNEFVESEEAKGHLLIWEYRKYVFAERCFKHELIYIIKNPNYIWLKIKRLFKLEPSLSKF